MKAKHFENVKNQIGYCGIWCGSCVVGNGTLIELTKRYKEIINNYGLKEWAPKDFDFSEFMKGLLSIQAIPSCQGCLKGDGRTDCEIRSCVLNKRIDGCTKCDQFMICDNNEILHKMRTGAFDAGLMVCTRNFDRLKHFERWKADLKRKWPSCVLFLPD